LKDNTDIELRGIIPSMITPFASDGSVSEPEMRRLTEHLISAGVHGLNPLASTGEIAYLDEAECRDIIRIVVNQANGRVPVVAGVTGFSTRQLVRAGRAAKAAGADALLAIMTTYFPLRRDGIVDHLRALAEDVGLPIVLYNNPKYSNADLAPDLVAELSTIDQIRYIKDASGITGRVLSIRETARNPFGVFSASAHIPTTVLWLGGVGWMAGPACLVPEASVRMYEAARAGDWTTAMSIQTCLWPLNELFQKHGLARCIKGGLAAQGFDVGVPRPPQHPLGPDGLAELTRALDAVSEGMTR